jgi:hypothetical protein
VVQFPILENPIENMQKNQATTTPGMGFELGNSRTSTAEISNRPVRSVLRVQKALVWGSRIRLKGPQTIDISILTNRKIQIELRAW